MSAALRHDPDHEMIGGSAGQRLQGHATGLDQVRLPIGLDLGPVGAGATVVTLGFYLTMSDPGQGFAFDYDVAFESPTAAPEPPTWAMAILGFAGLGAARVFRRRAGSAALGRQAPSSGAGADDPGPHAPAGSRASRRSATSASVSRAS